ncbi:MAG: cysteine peptidase family C39 domain-containing protein [bacterium]
MEGINCTHAVIVEEIGDDHARILDPSEGRKKVDIDKFRKSWEMASNLALVVSK